MNRQLLAFEVDCLACGVTYRPALTDAACPVCGVDADGLPDALQRREPDRGLRLFALVGLAMVLNLAILAWLAILYLDL